MRKKRSDCKMSRLTPAQQEEVFLLAQSMSLDAVCSDLNERFDFEISRQALSVWLAGERLSRKVSRQVAIANEIAEQARLANGGKLDAAIDAVVKAQALDAIQTANDPEVVADLVKCVLSMRKTEQDGRRLALLEKKAAMADKIEEAARNQKLSPEELSAKIKSIFGW